MAEVIYHDVKPTQRCARLSECNGILYFEPHISAGASKTPMSMKEQAAALLTRYEELLAQFGSDKHHIISVTCVIRDASDIGELNEAWDAWIDQGYQPPRNVIVGTTIAECYKLYITMIAAKIDG